MDAILPVLGALACLSALIIAGPCFPFPLAYSCGYLWSGSASSPSLHPVPLILLILDLVLLLLIAYLSFSLIMTTSTMTISSTAATTPKKLRRFKSQRKPVAPSNVIGNGDVEVNNDTPTASDLVKCADFPVLDRNKNSRPFKSLYLGTGATNRTLVLFIRHFFCGVSRPAWRFFVAYSAHMRLLVEVKTMLQHIYVLLHVDTCLASTLPGETTLHETGLTVHPQSPSCQPLPLLII